MMKMKLAVATLLLGIGIVAFAQPGDYAHVNQQTPKMTAPQNSEELAKQFELSQEIANQAWAIYTDYNAQKKAMHQKQREEMKAIRTKGSKPTDAEAEKAFYARIDSQRKMLDFEEASYKKFTAVISPTQTLQLMRESRQTNRHGVNKSQNVKASQAPVQTKTKP